MTRIVLLIALSAQTAVDPQVLYWKVRERVLADIDRLPAYTCVQTTTRLVYAAVPPRNRLQRCDSVIAAQEASKRQPPVSSWDRLRLEVAIVNGREVYSWAGAKRFEDGDLQKLTGAGHTVTGDFGSLTYNVLLGNVTMRFAGGRNIAEYAYSIPVRLSRYQVRIAGRPITVAYGGSVFIDPQTSDLVEVTARSAKLPESTGYCQAGDEVDYGRVRVGSRDALLPREARARVVNVDGVERVSVSSYSGCREYVGESTI